MEQAVLIRNEQKSDWENVEAITRKAFYNVYVPGCTEHYLVHIMREHEDFIPELDFVLELNGRVIGNIMYTKAKLTDEAGTQKEIVTFGPVCILPAYQRMGYGKLLMEHSFEKARQMGYDTIVIFGSPANYVSRGFKSCKKYNVCIENGKYPAAMMVKELRPHALDGHKWVYQDSPVMAISEEEAERLAEELKELNDTRKDMTEQGTEAAKLQVESWYQKDKVLVVFLPECHESLAGIIAGRLREYYQKPAIVLTRGEEAVKGSGRSIDEYHMFKKLTEVSDLLLKFGGHPLAAGLSLEEKNIDEFRRRLNENAGLTEEDFKAKVWIDVPMPVGYVTERLVRELSCLEPFGQGNEKPLFAEKSLRIRASRVLGRNRNVVKMTLEETDGHAIEALYFGDGTAFEEERAGRREIDVVYYPDINEYNGRKTLQAVIRRYKFRG